MVYLDNAATTPVRREVAEVIYEALLNNYGNPSSTYQVGKIAKHSMLKARQTLSDLLNVPETGFYITSGATEANNWAIRSQAKVARKLHGKNHIVTTKIEHPSVSEVTKYLAGAGFEVTYLSPDSQGQITVQDFIDATNEQTMGWITMAVNNEVGSILPVFELGEKAKERNLWFHVDAVQAIGHLDWDYAKLNCTSFVGSAHKFNAPKGIGFLVYRPFDKQMILEPLIYGGGQENKKRSGTENVPYILGMAKALELAKEEQIDTFTHYQTLQVYLYEQLDQYKIRYEINGDPNHRVPYINNLWLKGRNASQMLIKMDLNKLSISAGSACSAGSLMESNILRAYYPNESERLQESLRISFGIQTTKEDIDALIALLNKL